MITKKAAVFVSPGSIVPDEKPVSAVGSGDALICIATATICGMDIHVLAKRGRGRPWPDCRPWAGGRLRGQTAVNRRRILIVEYGVISMRSTCDE